jgi:hypothetical protein
MSVTPRLVLLLIALVRFVVAARDDPSPRLRLTPAGVHVPEGAFLAAALRFGGP